MSNQDKSLHEFLAIEFFRLAREAETLPAGDRGEERTSHVQTGLTNLYERHRNFGGRLYGGVEAVVFDYYLQTTYSTKFTLKHVYGECGILITADSQVDYGE